MGACSSSSKKKGESPMLNKDKPSSGLNKSPEEKKNNQENDIPNTNELNNNRVNISNKKEEIDEPIPDEKIKQITNKQKSIVKEEEEEDDYCDEDRTRQKKNPSRK